MYVRKYALTHLFNGYLHTNETSCDLILPVASCTLFVAFSLECDVIDNEGSYVLSQKGVAPDHCESI